MSAEASEQNRRSAVTDRCYSASCSVSNETKVKVCGVTNVDDAIACADAGVDFIGLNFSPQSRRCMSLAQGTEVTSAIRDAFPEIKFVGVFVNQERELVEKLARDLALDAVQLHGDEASPYVDELHAQFVIKALRVGSEFAPFSANDYDCDAILLDAWSEIVPGGTGKTFLWSIANEVRPFVKRLFLAGGLTPENVSDALRVVRPFAVDVCTGVEDSPGRKNHDKIKRFVEAARAANELRT